MTRILLVEPDDASARDMNAILGENPDWQVTRVASLLEAIRAAGETPFDAAILDYDQPDGTGLDILDFLRIGSPGIRILMVSEKGSEQIAFHALSHGVADYVTKDSHLRHELPRRVDALLDQTPSVGLVETLTPVVAYEQPPVAADRTRGKAAGTAVERALEVIVGGPILGAAMFDHHGKPLAARMPDGFDASGIGFALATLHGQVGALWTYGEVRPSGYEMLIALDAGLLAVTPIPGTFVVALLMQRDTDREKALEHMDMAARKLFETIRG